MPPRSPFRFLAPGALLAAILAVLLVIGGGGDATEAPDAAVPSARTTAEGPRRTWYRVRSGDSLAAIADRHGLSVERLTELNPEIDPQVLQAGQRLRLRPAR